MSSSRLALPRIFVRAMHSGGRPLPHPNLGGATQPLSPQETASNLPAPPQSGDSSIDASLPPVDELKAASVPESVVGTSPTPSTGPTGARDEFRAGLTPPNRTDLPMFTYKGKRIPVRPPRSIPVDLPSGFPEPTTWPPNQEYHDMVENMPKAKRHPLWQFFHISAGAAEKLSPGMEQPPEVGTFGPKADGSDEANVNPGRAWCAAELRMKSFADLHTLWYVLLKERNVLATQAEDKRRFGIPSDATRTEIGMRKYNIRKSMARIKFVLQERRLGLIAAVAPQFESTQPPPSWTDPARSYEAMRATQLDYPDIRVPKILRGLDVQAGATTVGDEQVNVEEVESRDEGFGGGREAEEFVDDIEIDRDGKVKQTH